MAKGGKQNIKHAEEVVTREYTIHLRKLLHGVGFKKRAPRAVMCEAEGGEGVRQEDDGNRGALPLSLLCALMACRTSPQFITAPSCAFPTPTPQGFGRFAPTSGWSSL